MVSGREEAGKDSCVGEQYRLERSSSSRELGRLEPQGDNAANPQELSPCDADCPARPGDPGRLRTKGFLLEPQAASGMSVLRGRTGGEGP